MIITDKDGFGWALGDCSDIGLAHELLEEDDNTYYVGIQLKGDGGFSQMPFATKEEAEAVLKQIDAAMTATLNHWNPAHNVPSLVAGEKTEGEWHKTIVKETNLEDVKKYYEKAKQCEENAKQFYEQAYQLLQSKNNCKFNPVSPTTGFTSYSQIVSPPMNNSTQADTALKNMTMQEIAALAKRSTPMEF